MLVSIAVALHGYAFVPIRLPRSELCGGFWAGGGFQGSALDLKPNGSFVYGSWGCTGEGDQNDGRWSYDGKVVILKPRASKKPLVFSKQHDLAAMGTRFVPMKWGKVSFLVCQSRFAEFSKLGETSSPAADLFHIGLAYHRGTQANDPGLIDIQFRDQNLPSAPVRERRLELTGHGSAIKIGASS